MIWGAGQLPFVVLATDPVLPVAPARSRRSDQPSIAALLNDLERFKCRNCPVSFHLYRWNELGCPDLIVSYTQIGANHLDKKSDENKTKSL